MVSTKKKQRAVMETEVFLWFWSEKQRAPIYMGSTRILSQDKTITRISKLSDQDSGPGGDAVYRL